jgi:hypothetical protein
MAVLARQLGVLILLLSTGCASFRAPPSLTELFRPRVKPATEKVEEEKNVEHRRDEEQARDDHPAIAAAEPREQPIRHDPSTRMLIDAELRDASAEERQEWLAFLNTIEDAQIPYVLQARRMAQGRQQERIATLQADAAGADASTPLRTASASTAVDDDPAITTAAGASPVTPAASQTRSPARPAEPSPSAGSAWQKKLKSFADPNWLWSRSTAEDQSRPEEEAPKKSDRAVETAAVSEPSATIETESPDAEAANVSLAALTPGSRSAAGTEALETHLAPGSALWQDEMQKLISLLEAETSSTAAPEKPEVDRSELRQQIGLRMLYLVVNEPQKAQQPIPGLPAAEQEFWTTLFLALAEDLDERNVTDPAQRATQTVAQLRSAAWQLQSSAHLKLRNVAFCRQIDGFGNYEILAADDLIPGEAVLIYAEVRNFASVPTAEGYYSTRIKSTVEIYTVGQERQLMDRSTFDVTEDQCRTIRSDYYHSYRINIPSHLSSGPHTLKLTIQDEATGKTATETISFTIR